MIRLLALVAYMFASIGAGLVGCGGARAAHTDTGALPAASADDAHAHHHGKAAVQDAVIPPTAHDHDGQGSAHDCCGDGPLCDGVGCAGCCGLAAVILPAVMGEMGQPLAPSEAAQAPRPAKPLAPEPTAPPPRRPSA